jgi:hypothetical protein
LFLRRRRDGGRSGIILFFALEIRRFFPVSKRRRFRSVLL